MTTIRSVSALVVSVAFVALSTASVASASPFIYGTANSVDHEIFQFDLTTNTKTTLLNTFTDLHCWFGACELESLVFDSTGRIIYTMEDTGQVHRFTPGVPGSDETLASGLVVPKDLVLDPSGTSVLVSEAADGGGHKITRIDLTCGSLNCGVTHLGGGSGTLYAVADGPHGLAFVGNNFYANIGDRTGGASDSHIAQIDPITGAILANHSGTLNSLDGLTFDLDPNHPFLYATSVVGGFVYEFDPANLAGGPVRTLFSGQFTGAAIDGLTFDFDGNLYVAGFSSDPLQAALYKCGIPTSGSGTCVSLANITGIDDLAPFVQSNTVTGQDTASAPEPGTVVLLGAGLLAGVVRMRRRPRT